MQVVLADLRRFGLHEQLARLLPEVIRQFAGCAHQIGFVAWDEAGVELGGGKSRVTDHTAQEGKVGTHAANAGFVEHRQQTQACFLTILAPGNQLAEHRIVEG